MDRRDLEEVYALSGIVAGLEVVIDQEQHQLDRLKRIRDNITKRIAKLESRGYGKNED